MTLNNTAKTIRNTPQPCFPTLNEGGIYTKPKTMTAKWTMDNGRLDCYWVSQ